MGDRPAAQAAWEEKPRVHQCVRYRFQQSLFGVAGRRDANRTSPHRSRESQFACVWLLRGGKIMRGANRQQTEKDNFDDDQRHDLLVGKEAKNFVQRQRIVGGISLSSW